jgi:hypothetical protein
MCGMIPRPMANFRAIPAAVLMLPNVKAFSCEPRAGTTHRRPTEVRPLSLACSSTASVG